MAISCIPTYPLFILGIAEPLMLIWAFIVAHQNPAQFYLDQAPAHTYDAADIVFTPQAHVYTLQIVSIYVLLAALGVICLFTPHASVSKAYLFVLAIADFGHIYGIYAALGPDVFYDWRNWNDMIWGGVGGSVVLNIHRWLTLAGAFGPVVDQQQPASKTSVKKA